jgi:hypothetical protein
MGLERSTETGLPVSVSSVVAQYQETAQMLQRHPEVAVGMHLTLNPEMNHELRAPSGARGSSSRVAT